MTDSSSTTRLKVIAVPTPGNLPLQVAEEKGFFGRVKDLFGGS